MASAGQARDCCWRAVLTLSFNREFPHLRLNYVDIIICQENQVAQICHICTGAEKNEMPFFLFVGSSWVGSSGKWGVGCLDSRQVRMSFCSWRFCEGPAGANLERVALR